MRISARCPHGIWRVQCKECNGGGVCIHGDLREICDMCLYSELCEHNKRKLGCHVCRKSSLKQRSLYHTVCSALEKTLPHDLPPPLSRLIPKKEKLNIIQEHIANLSKVSKSANSPL